LFEAAGLADKEDKGWIDLNDISAKSFVKTLGALRYWQR
jgi:hypothetical protein